MKPVRLSASATLALPRWGLWFLAIIYILPGLIGRDYFQSDEAASLGIVWSMVNGNLHDWFFLNIAQLPSPKQAPLSFWLTALSTKLFSAPLGEIMAARMATIIFFLLGGLSIWRATFLLGRRPETQPVPLVFGGEPNPTDYGRVLADGALLIYIGSLGLLQHSHESKPEALLVTLIAFLFYVCVRYAEKPNKKNTLLLGLAFGYLGLTQDWASPLIIWLSLFPCFMSLHKNSLQTSIHLLFAALIGVCVFAIWPIGAHLISPTEISPALTWFTAKQDSLGTASFESIVFFVKNGTLFFWPAWPFAAWAIYAWRKQFRDIHITLPLYFIIALSLIALLHTSVNERLLLPILPPLAVLAAFGLPTMRRQITSAVDWFSMMALTIGASFIWVGWIAKQTGWPTWLARNIYKLTPNFTATLDAFSLIIAICATLTWAYLVYWRLGRRPKVIWRTVVLSSSGIILCWALLATLWLPWISYGKGYQSVAQEIMAKISPKDALVCAKIRKSARASLSYLNNLNFAKPGSDTCKYLLVQDKLNRSELKEKPILSDKESADWRVIWQGRRPNERDERIYLYQSTH